MYDFLAAQSIEKAHLIVQKNYCIVVKTVVSLSSSPSLVLYFAIKEYTLHSAEDIIKTLLKLTETLPREYLKYFFYPLSLKKIP